MQSVPVDVLQLENLVISTEYKAGELCVRIAQLLENLVISTEYKAIGFVVLHCSMLENLVISTEYKANRRHGFACVLLENLVISTEYKAFIIGSLHGWKLENLVISKIEGAKCMKLNKQMCQVIADLEEIIGSECYNPNSYNGWTDMEGCEFRYPISIPDEYGNYEKYRSNINWCLNDRSASDNKETVKYMKYKFGSNELFIGLGLIKVLQYLENRYNIDFCELEKKR